MSKTVNKAIDILETFLKSEEPLTLTKISKTTGTNSTTAYRLLKTLTKRGLVSFNKETLAYTLGMRMMDFSFAIRRSLRFADIAHGPLSKFSEEKKVDIFIAVLDADTALVAEEFGNTHEMRINSPVGKRLPLHCTASGRILLTSMPKNKRQEILGGELYKYTKNTITDRAEMERILLEVEAEGKAFDDEEYKLGLHSVAVPLFSAQGDIIASVGIVGSKSHLDSDRLVELTSELISYAAEISEINARLGI